MIYYSLTNSYDLAHKIEIFVVHICAVQILILGASEYKHSHVIITTDTVINIGKNFTRLDCCVDLQ